MKTSKGKWIGKPVKRSDSSMVDENAQ